MKKVLMAVVLFCFTYTAAAAAAPNVVVPKKNLPQVKPEKVGFSSARLAQVSNFMQRNVDEGKHVGFVAMIARHGQIVHYEAVGKQGLDNDKPMSKDVLFRIFSMTKPITSVAMLMLYEEGHFQMNDPVAKYLPALADLKVYQASGDHLDASPITIEQLFTHTAGLTYGFRPDGAVDQLYRQSQLFQAQNLDGFIQRLSALPLQYQPGTRFHYSVATDVLGALVEKISGMTLEAFFAERIFEPLGMRDTFFSVPEAKLSRLATNHGWDPQQQKLVLLPPQLRRPATGVTLFSGGGGLYSTAMDYMIFCEMLRRGGTYNGARLLGRKTIEYMTADHLTEAVRLNGATEFPAAHLYPGHSFGLGVSLVLNPGIADVVSSAGAYSWGGAADTKFWVDPAEDLVVVLMTQLMGSPWETRYQMKVATYQALQ